MLKRFLAAVFIALLLFGLLSSFAAADNGSTIVYVTRTGECYHTGSCSYLSKSKIEMTLADAAKKYRPCSRCKPPRLDTSDTSSQTRSNYIAPVSTPRVVSTPRPTVAQRSTAAATYRTSTKSSQTSNTPTVVMIAAAAFFVGLIIPKKSK